MDLSSVIIEVTRKCNMSCEHCLRGCSQNMDIEETTLENFFSKVSSIGNLTITGGEPSLVPEKINAIVAIAKKHNVSIETFYMVTNGKEVTDNFMNAVLSLYLYCGDKESCNLMYSDDCFHDYILDENRSKLEAFRFTSPRNDSHISYDNVISEGRSEEGGFGSRKLEISGITIDEYDDDRINEGDIYLNCKGNILSCCDLSYESQDIKKLIIGNINGKSFNLKNAIKRFNKRLDKIGKLLENFKYGEEFAS